MSYNKWMRLLDADSGVAGGGGEPAPETGAEEAKDAGGNDAQPQTFKDALSQHKEWQAELDRRISDAVKKATDSERERQKVIQDDLVEETMRVAKMTDAERDAYYANKAKQKAAEREAEITKRELSLDARIALQDRSLPASFVDLLNFQDRQAMEASIDTLEKTFTAAVQDAVAERLKGGPAPKDSKTEAAPGKEDTQEEEELAKLRKIAGIRNK